MCLDRGNKHGKERRTYKTQHFNSQITLRSTNPPLDRSTDTFQIATPPIPIESSHQNVHAANPPSPPPPPRLLHQPQRRYHQTPHKPLPMLPAPQPSTQTSNMPHASPFSNSSASRETRPPPNFPPLPRPRSRTTPTFFRGRRESVRVRGAELVGWEVGSGGGEGAWCRWCEGRVQGI
jgi:hypothetical protein